MTKFCRPTAIRLKLLMFFDDEFRRRRFLLCLDPTKDRLKILGVAYGEPRAHSVSVVYNLGARSVDMLTECRAVFSRYPECVCGS
jgi:hypothetical protein